MTKAIVEPLNPKIFNAKILEAGIKKAEKEKESVRERLKKAERKISVKI